MYTSDQIKLTALAYAERNNIVNSKTIQAIEFGIMEGYRTFTKQDCLNRLVGHFDSVKSSEEQAYAYTGFYNIDNKKNAIKCKELLSQIKLEL